VVTRLAAMSPEDRAAAKDIPNRRLIEIPEVGHIPHLEAPEQFHRALLEFLGK
jgi:pimeloyl-ACP methyl ester carboxylesterase